MQRGFALKSFVIILVIIISMILIAFFVQRRSGDDNSEEAQEEFQEEMSEEVEYLDDSDSEEREEGGEEEENQVDVSEGIIEVTDLTEEESRLAIKAKEDLSNRLGVDYDRIFLIEVREVVFSDDSLGTSQPGETYSQDPVDGHIIILYYNDIEYRYHASQDKFIFVQ